MHDCVLNIRFKDSTVLKTRLEVFELLTVALSTS